MNQHSPLMAALSAAASGQLESVEITYAQGVNICDYPYGQNPGFPNMPCDKAGNTSQIAAAVDVAAAADVAVVFLGSDQTTEAENFDRDSLELAGNGSQAALLDAILKVQV